MKTRLSAFAPALLSAAAFLGLSPALAAPLPKDAPVTEAELRSDIALLAGDAFEGREPGTAGEVRTIAQLIGSWAAAGLQPLEGSATPWLQPVPLMESHMVDSEALFKAHGRSISLNADELAIRGRDQNFVGSDLPVIFAGYGVDRDGKVNMDVRGKVVIIMLSDPPFAAKGGSPRERRLALTQAGAAGVLSLSDDALPWGRLVGALEAPSISLASSDAEPPLRGFLSLRAFDKLAEKLGRSGEALRADARAADYSGLALPLTVDVKTTTDVRRFDSHNVVARLKGRNPDGKVVILMGHWDHLGQCGDESAEDRICNGAVDNASGMAALNAIAKRLGKGQRPDRDVIFLGTTAEERGLLGANHFVANPPFPLQNITAALNLDTIAVAKRNAPVAVIGRGRAGYDLAIRTISEAMGRTMDDDGEADAFVHRQDGAAFHAKNVPAFMVGGSFSDMGLLQSFLGGPYHGPKDELHDALELGGAADDADLHIALTRLFADRGRWDGEKLISR